MKVSCLFWSCVHTSIKQHKFLGADLGPTQSQVEAKFTKFRVTGWRVARSRRLKHTEKKTCIKSTLGSLSLSVPLFKPL